MELSIHNFTFSCILSLELLWFHNFLNKLHSHSIPGLGLIFVKPLLLHYYVVVSKRAIQ